MEKTQEQIAIEKQRTRLTKFFHEACAGYQLIEEGDHILIGLSGGKDSLLLTELLGKRAQIYKPRFRARGEGHQPTPDPSLKGRENAARDRQSVFFMRMVSAEDAV